jgi:hypothetical protein
MKTRMRAILFILVLSEHGLYAQIARDQGDGPRRQHPLHSAAGASLRGNKRVHPETFLTQNLTERLVVAIQNFTVVRRRL